MTSTDALSEWLEAVLAGKVPAGAAAYCVNIYGSPKGYDLELVGAAEFDPDDSDWACAELLTTRTNLLTLSRRSAGADWKRALTFVKKRVKLYLASGTLGAEKLKSTQAVAVGFVDGDLNGVWRRSSKTRA